MAADLVYVRHSSGRQRLIAESELEGLKAQGWREENRVSVTVEKKPAKKKPAKKKAE
ncbi:MAG: hypothetical protein Unbinned4350contig1002_11 [Prokaryotic dsDNA virus sp.]|nr:MAG: hypothetical protein Unbinned4350contig1002_11 [Prokaryotic dsDNA virus sp.]|tara:strand:- start:13396 stop:13566 length:171 start_codon:yes stop_codon:yes gene_type:complete